MNLDNKALSFASKLAKYCYNRTANDAPYIANSTVIGMVIPLDRHVSIAFSINNPFTVAELCIDGARIKNITLPMLEYDKRFNIYKYAESCRTQLFCYMSNHNIILLQNSINSWLEVYKNGYTFTNFKKAVYNNIECAYSYTLSDNINEDCAISDKLISNISFKYQKHAKHVKLYLNFPNKASGYDGIDIIDLKPDFFYRKFDIDSLLTIFAHIVPEVAIYFRNKNIATLLKDIK